MSHTAQRQKVLCVHVSVCGGQGSLGSPLPHLQVRPWLWWELAPRGTTGSGFRQW